MEIILLKDVENVGTKHELVKVKNGFGRNFLIPQGMAIIANKENKAKLDKIVADEQAKVSARLEEYKEVAAKLGGVTLKVGAKAGTSGKIFGSVNNVQIATALKEQFEIEIERTKINIPEEIKTLGTYTAVIDLHPEVECKLEFEVVEG